MCVIEEGMTCAKAAVSRSREAKKPPGEKKKRTNNWHVGDGTPDLHPPLTSERKGLRTFSPQRRFGKKKKEVPRISQGNYDPVKERGEGRKRPHRLTSDNPKKEKGNGKKVREG